MGQNVTALMLGVFVHDDEPQLTEDGEWIWDVAATSPQFRPTMSVDGDAVGFVFAGADEDDKTDIPTGDIETIAKDHEEAIEAAREKWNALQGWLTKQQVALLSNPMLIITTVEVA